MKPPFKTTVVRAFSHNQSLPYVENKNVNFISFWKQPSIISKEQQRDNKIESSTFCRFGVHVWFGFLAPTKGVILKTCPIYIG